MPSVSLPYPPTVNTYWMRCRHGMTLSPKAREYRDVAAGELRDLRESERISKPVGVRVHLTAFMPDARTRDIDNILKPLFDAMTHAGAWDDDSQIDDLRVIRGGIDRDDPRVEIHWERIGVCDV